jgi:hypothetical protein
VEIKNLLEQLIIDYCCLCGQKLHEIKAESILNYHNYICSDTSCCFKSYTFYRNFYIDITLSTSPAIKIIITSFLVDTFFVKVIHDEQEKYYIDEAALSLITKYFQKTTLQNFSLDGLDCYVIKMKNLL